MPLRTKKASSQSLQIRSVISIEKAAAEKAAAELLDEFFPSSQSLQIRSVISIEAEKASAEKAAAESRNPFKSGR